MRNGPEGGTRRIQSLGNVLQEQHASTEMEVELSRCPLPGGNLLARERKGGVITEHSKDAKAEVYLMFEMRMELAQAHVWLMNDKFTSHLVYDAVLIGFLLK